MPELRVDRKLQYSAGVQPFLASLLLLLIVNTDYFMFFKRKFESQRYVRDELVNRARTRTMGTQSTWPRQVQRLQNQKNFKFQDI